jgi:hypothetical protein
MKQNAIVPIERIERKIYFIRGQKVILDFDLARLYEVETKVLLQAVKRNIGRFPDDFMFQLTESEFRGLRSQFVTSKGRGGRRFLAYAFTEHGVAMLSSVLHSERAVQVNIAIIRAFVRIREFLSTHKDLARKLEELERKYESHDSQIKAVFEAIRELMKPPQPTRRRIGF